MIQEYKGIYHNNEGDVEEEQKVFYEHGAHFEYSALCKILEKMQKGLNIRINSSIPKKRLTSINKKKIMPNNKNDKGNLKLDKNQIESLKDDNNRNIKVNLKPINCIENKCSKKQNKTINLSQYKGKSSESKNKSKNIENESFLEKTDRTTLKEKEKERLHNSNSNNNNNDYAKNTSKNIDNNKANLNKIKNKCTSGDSKVILSYRANSNVGNKGKKNKVDKNKINSIIKDDIEKKKVNKDNKKKNNCINFPKDSLDKPDNYYYPKLNNSMISGIDNIIRKRPKNDIDKNIKRINRSYYSNRENNRNMNKLEIAICNTNKKNQMNQKKYLDGIKTDRQHNFNLIKNEELYSMDKTYKNNKVQQTTTNNNINSDIISQKNKIKQLPEKIKFKGNLFHNKKEKKEKLKNKIYIIKLKKNSNRVSEDKDNYNNNTFIEKNNKKENNNSRIKSPTVKKIPLLGINPHNLLESPLENKTARNNQGKYIFNKQVKEKLSELKKKIKTSIDKKEKITKGIENCSISTNEDINNRIKNKSGNLIENSLINNSNRNIRETQNKFSRNNRTNKSNISFHCYNKTFNANNKKYKSIRLNINKHNLKNKDDSFDIFSNTDSINEQNPLMEDFGGRKNKSVKLRNKIFNNNIKAKLLKMSERKKINKPNDLIKLERGGVKSEKINSKCDDTGIEEEPIIEKVNSSINGSDFLSIKFNKGKINIVCCSSKDRHHKDKEYLSKKSKQSSNKEKKNIIITNINTNTTSVINSKSNIM